MKRIVVDYVFEIYTQKLYAHHSAAIRHHNDHKGDEYLFVEKYISWNNWIFGIFEVPDQEYNKQGTSKNKADDYGGTSPVI